MAFRILNKRWHKITTIVLVSSVALILILGLLVNSYWSPILSSKVKEIVEKSSDGLYTVSFSSAELHVIRGTIDIYNINLKPDTSVYNLKKNQNLAPNNLVELRVKRLTLTHIHPFRLYFLHKLEIGEVALDEPVINISYQLNQKKDTVLARHKTVWEKISKSLRSIRIGDILLGDVKLKYEDYSGNKLTISEFKEMDLSARDLLIDSATQTDKSRLLYCRDIMIELNNYSGKSPNGLYTYKFDHLKLSTLQKRLNIEGLTLRPIKPEQFFSKSRRDKFEFRLDSLQLNQFDFLNYHKYRLITASSLILNNGNIEISGNPNKKKTTTDRVITFPNAGLYKINADVELDTVLLHHINVYYTGFNHKSNKTGTISFNNTGGRLFNVTTRPAALQKNNICTVDLTSWFMNRGKLDVSFTFNLTDQDKSFTYKGTLGPMNLKDVNPAIIPLTMVKIQSGTLKRMDFDISANRSNGHGKVLVLYNDVKVNILKPDSEFDKLKSRPIASLYANLFIIKHNNPDIAGGVPRSFYVSYNRPAEMPFFKFAWQTLLAGIKPAAGFDKKKQDEVIALKNKNIINKENRKIKKQQRQERRTERRLKKTEQALESGSKGGK